METGMHPEMIARMMQLIVTTVTTALLQETSDEEGCHWFFSAMNQARPTPSGCGPIGETE